MDRDFKLDNRFWCWYHNWIIYSLIYVFFANAMKPTPGITFQIMALDIVITIAMAAFTGAVIALVNEKLK